MPLTARDVMSSPVTTVTPATSLVDLARILTEDQISGAPVVDIEARLVGIVSKTDLLERLIDEATEYTSNPSFSKLFNLIDELEDVPDSERTDQSLDWMPEMAEASDSENLGNVEDIMQTEVVKVAPNAPADSLAALMSRNRIHRVVVVDADRVVGIVTSLDLLAHFPAAPARSAAVLPKRHAASSSRKAANRRVRSDKHPRQRPQPRGKTKAASKSKPRKKKSASRR